MFYSNTSNLLSNKCLTLEGATVRDRARFEGGGGGGIIEVPVETSICFLGVFNLCQRWWF